MLHKSTDEQNKYGRREVSRDFFGNGCYSFVNGFADICITNRIITDAMSCTALIHRLKLQIYTDMTDEVGSI